MSEASQQHPEQRPTALNRVYSRRPVRFGVQFAADAAAWAVAIVTAVSFRYDFDSAQFSWAGALGFSALAILTQGVAGYQLGLYRGRYRFGSFHEARALTVAVLIVAVFLALMSVVFSHRLGVPRSTSLFAFPIAFLLMAAVRYLKRVYVERQRRPGDQAERTLVYGAGSMGANVIGGFLRDPDSKYRPVGIIDDDPDKAQLSLDGVPVVGSGADIGHAAKDTAASVLIIAMARVDAARIREISDASDAAGLRVRIVPSMNEVLEQSNGGPVQIRDIAVEDLIGRNPVDTEVESIAGYLKGKRVLVTGAGGSIGSELCRQITRYEPGELIMLDRDESGLHGTQMSMVGHGLLDTKDVVLADIRDEEALQAIFTDRKPEVVFHAAALKHLPMLEQYPGEAWKTNVLGTLNVLQAAMAVGVGTFVNISTDKAANPSSVLGHSKRVAEKLTAWAAAESDGTYLSVRFGNVIGSRGSMLPTFTAQIEAGGPVTVTHPEVTRYFMTIPEACQLVVQAGGVGRDGEVLILDMGEPVRILDIAKRMIAMSGKQVNIRYTGLREGEKLHEELFGTIEQDSRPYHSKISHATVCSLNPTNLDRRLWEARCVNNPSGPESRSIG